ncbi:HAMP domain-containing protein [Bradyrhizobium manausense]|uniref:histidine kinase n=1 Tax=Bradyrhizobium TaxID=374 RepID=UPI001BADC69D|nr:MULTISPECIES: ATP-binding protein [Bradyrhizobium]MBR0826532.1 HAMP domain-containing protein [Bradyrhizobium manausense]UVO28927.1 HAMP domain-containing protein [Bradyrhizobium arachidis]
MRETKVLRRLPVFDLKWSLLRQVAAVALLCFLGGAAISVFQAEQETSKANRAVGDAVGRFLERPLLFAVDVPPGVAPGGRNRFDLRARFREMDPFLDQVISPGQCVQLDEAGKVVVSSCLGFRSPQGEAPAWFSAFYRWAVGSRMTYERPVTHQGLVLGKVIVSSNPSAVTARAWSDISRMLGLSAATIGALGVLVYFVVERALRPTRDVVSGLNRLAAGDLKCRLPPFRLAELQRISNVFNDLATTLEVATSERADMARRLVEAREQERRHLARVLHDELAQSLSAMSATAASIKVTASTDCPSLVPEAQAITETAGNIMKGLRRTVQELRLQEIDDVGLLTSLEELIAGHNRRSCGKTRFFLETHGDLNALPPAITGHIFHIVQEGLTNAVKHAQAANVHAMVRIDLTQDGAPGSAAGLVEVTVEDDGAGLTQEIRREAGFGLGLIGIRERTLALGGQMNVVSRSEKGLILSVAIPVLNAPGSAS